MRTKSASIPPTSDTELASWFSDACPDGWFATSPTVRFDADEILVTGDLGEPGAGLDHEQQIVAFREATRDQRMEIADNAQATFQRRVSWGVECGDAQVLFTTVNAPAMTRLRLDERAVLDSLIAGGVARSRSEALAWCVRLVGQHEGDWIAELRDAVDTVKRVRDDGPSA
ncbi:MAG: hypothetical protein AAGC53_01575 [Actinomycetota bacterium]